MAKTVSLTMARGLLDAVEYEAARTGPTPEVWIETKLLRWAGLAEFGSARGSPTLPLGGAFAMAAPSKVRVREDVVIRVARAAEDAGVSISEAIGLIIADDIGGGS